MWALMPIYQVPSDKTASLHLEFPACTMKRMTVVNLLGTAGLISYCNIATSSSHRVSRASLLLHTQEAPWVITEKGSGRGPCTILESFEQWLLPSLWEKSLPLSLVFSLQQACRYPDQRISSVLLLRGTEHLWGSYSATHLLPVKNQIIKLRKLGREIGA